MTPQKIDPLTESRDILKGFAADPRAQAFGISRGVRALIVSLEELQHRQAILANALLEIDAVVLGIDRNGALRTDMRNKLQRLTHHG